MIDYMMNIVGIDKVRIKNFDEWKGYVYNVLKFYFLMSNRDVPFMDFGASLNRYVLSSFSDRDIKYYIDNYVVDADVLKKLSIELDKYDYKVKDDGDIILNLYFKDGNEITFSI